MFLGAWKTISEETIYFTKKFMNRVYNGEI